MFTGSSSLSRFSTRLCPPRPFACTRLAPLHTSCRGPVRRWNSTCNTPRIDSSSTSASKIPWWMYEPIEDIEPFEQYAVGGYYPVRIGDQFCSSRYHIVHKLGYGTASTTWLARDERLAKYVAIKFVVSGHERLFESAILRSLRNGQGYTGEAHTGMAMIPEMLDEFEVEGPEIQGTRGKHHCLVTTPARMNLSEAREASHDLLFQPSVARAIAAQLIQAVAFMHSRGIVHAYLHEANILLCLPSSINSTTPDQLYKKYGQPKLEQITRLDGQPLDYWVPTHGVVPIWFGDASNTISLADSHIFLSDFSESFQPADDVRQSSHTPFILRSPEILLEPTSQVSFPAEIWSLACAIFTIVGQRSLFESWFPSKDRILAEHVDTLGYLPTEWWASWEDRDQYFDDQLRRVDGSSRRLLEDRLEYSIQEPRKQAEMAEMDEEEKQAFLALLRSMLSFRLEDRPSAQQVVESNWMQKWATPAFELMRDNLKT